MKPCLVDRAPEGELWLHELKYDGYRTELLVESGEARAFTRTGLDWTGRYRDVVAAATSLDVRGALIDGEIILQGAAGLSDFSSLRRELARARPKGLVFMAFDLLHLDGLDLRQEPVEARRERLRYLLTGLDADAPIRFSDHILGNGPDVFAAAEAMGAEGIVSKRLGSRYRSGPSKSWQKVKSFTEAEYVVIGTSKGDLAPVALLARETDDQRLEYAGAAMVTFSEGERERFWRANERLKTPKPALHMDPRPETSWLKPEMRVRVRHLKGEEMLRHATVKSIAWIPPEPGSAAAAEPLMAERAETRERIAAGPGREPGFKVEHGAVPGPDVLVAYYRAMAPFLLAHVAGRPLNLFRCKGRFCQFQRNRNHPPTEQKFDPPIQSVPIRQKNGRTEDYLYVDSVEGIVACAAAGSVEFHAWGSRAEDVERPDRIAIDLDPGEGVGFAEVKSAARQVRRSLQAIGLTSWPLLTGGKGVHVVLPFTPSGEWDEVRDFARTFCAALAAAAPDRFTIALPMAERAGRIFLDYLRNQRTATAIMPWSLRARPGSPIAVPLTWPELDKIESADAFTLAEVDKVVKRARSPKLKDWGWAEQSLPAL
jgi:bifunctional non-homologous end joining protein LigD